MSKYFNRRDFLNGAASSLTIAAMMPGAKARLLHGGPGQTISSSLSKRNVINVNFVSGTNDYAFIDHCRSGSGFWSPFGGTFIGAAPTFGSIVDANGWPTNVTGVAGQAYGGGFEVPDPANFNGPYIIDFNGNGTVLAQVQFPTGAVGTFTIGNGSNGMPVPVNCSPTGGSTIVCTSTAGAGAGSFQYTFTSTSTGPQGIELRAETGSTPSIKNIRHYRAADATDLGNGLIFRAPWKQSIVGLCPSAVRFMNWVGGNTARNNRWENRTLPANAGYGSGQGTGIGFNWTASPNYQTDATGNNQLVVATATPTTGNPQTTPTNMVHGELATIRIPAGGGGIRCASQLKVSTITNDIIANGGGLVTTATAHGYNTGDIIGHQFSPVNNSSGNISTSSTPTVITGVLTASMANIVAGMYIFGPGIPANTTVVSTTTSPNTITMSNSATITAKVSLAFYSMALLQYLPCTITVINTTQYRLNVDTSAMPAFSTNSVAVVVSYQFQTLQVGSGGSGPFARTAYPIYGGNPSSTFGNFLNASNYYTLYFDKTLSGQTDGSGNPIMGAWQFSGKAGAHDGDVPIEVCVQLINELNAMSPAHTIGMWMNIPAWGLSSMDPDYSTSSDWAINCLDTVLNPSSSVRVSGYSALGYSGATKLNTPILIVEYSNEAWSSDSQNGWLVARGIYRWPTSYPSQDYQDMQALRTTCMATDVKGALSSLLTNTKFVIGVWTAFGMGSNPASRNYTPVFGGNVTASPIFTGDWYTNDTLTVSKGWGTPLSNHDGVNPACYVAPAASYYSTAAGTGTFTDDSAMYNGVDNSGTLSMTGGTGGVASTTLTITAVASQTPVVNQPLVGPGITSPTTIILGVSGTSPNFTLTLSQTATVTNGSTITAPLNGGGNYIGAANTTQAIVNIVAAVTASGNSTSTTNLANVLYPQFATQIGPTKVVLSYEGGQALQTQTGVNAGKVLTAGDSLFSLAAVDSTQLGAAQKTFFDNLCAISTGNVFMPSAYIFIQGGAGPVASQTQQQWGYCLPDSYAIVGSAPTEGQALLNNGAWAAMSARNVALPN